MTKNLTSAAALVFLLASSALAADVYQPEQIEQPPMEVQSPVAIGSGWYVRGDIGYDDNNLRGAHYFQGSNGTVSEFGSAKLSSSYGVGAGIGYQANEYLRVDTTLDYMFNSKFRGSTRGGCGSVAGPCVSSDISALTAYSLMANAYVDIGTYGIITPYVGAGIGGTHVKWGNLRNTSCSVTDPDNCDPTITHRGRGGWRFSYGLMAGAAIDVTCNVKADIGYRYRHVSGGDMFGYVFNGGPGYDKGFDIHEGRVGMRYNFGGCEQAYMPPVEIPQAPAVYK